MLPAPSRIAEAVPLGISSESYCFHLATILKLTPCAGMTKMVNQLKKKD